MEKLDLNKMYKDYYAAKTKPAFVEIEEANYLAIKGMVIQPNKSLRKGFRLYMPWHTQSSLTSKCAKKIL